MQIPPFPLPSRSATLIEFRVPTVEDGLLFCDLMDSQEEASTTRYLNHMQDTSKRALDDAGLWTGEDRRTALWWIFISTNDSVTLPFSYSCRCGETHFIDLDVLALGDTTTALAALPSKKDTITVQGKSHSVIVKPMNGYAVEHIEMLRNELDELNADSIEHKNAANKMAITELAHCLTFDAQPEDENEALEYKIALIESMYLNTEFHRAFVLVETRLRQARHGLLTKYDSGRFYLVATINECKTLVEKGGEATRTLLVPFHANQFIAAF